MSGRKIIHEVNHGRVLQGLATEGWHGHANCIAGVTGWWIRSRSVFDAIRIPQKDELHVIISNQESLSWGRYQDVGRGDVCKFAKLSWQSDPFKMQPPGFTSTEEFYEWRITLGRFDFYKASDAWQSRVTWAIPYWSIVIPLILLSACLLLSKLPNVKPKEPT